MRDLEFQVELEGTAEEVWRLLTEGEGIRRWFAPESRVTPGVGGTVWLSWGPGMEGEAPITGWEPGQRFEWTESSGRVITFRLEAADGGKTILRLVHSGFGMDGSFDSEIDSTGNGWRSFLALLAWDLRTQRGRAGQHVFRMRMGERDRSEWQAAVLRALSFAREEGGVSLRLGEGLAFRGEVLFERAPGYLIVTLGADGALALFLEPCGGTTALTSSWMLRGEAVARAEEIGAAWDVVLKALA